MWLPRKRHRSEWVWSHRRRLPGAITRYVMPPAGSISTTGATGVSPAGKCPATAPRRLGYTSVTTESEDAERELGRTGLRG